MRTVSGVWWNVDVIVELLVVEPAASRADPGVRGQPPNRLTTPPLRTARTAASEVSGSPTASMTTSEPWPSAAAASAGCSARSRSARRDRRRRRPARGPSPGARAVAAARAAAPPAGARGPRTSGRSGRPRSPPRDCPRPHATLLDALAPRRPAARPSPPRERPARPVERQQVARHDPRRERGELGVGAVPEQQVVAQARAVRAGSKSQAPQGAELAATTARARARSPRRPRPRSSTTPATSWPKTAGGTIIRAW